MAKRALNPLADGAHLQDGKFSWDVPGEILKGLSPTGVSGSGIVLANVTQRFSLIHTDAKGDLPVNYQISVSIKRDPILSDDKEYHWQVGEKTIKATERDAVEAASKESKNRQAERADKETKERQAAIAATQQLTRDMLREGMQLAGAMGGTNNLAAAVKTVAEILPAVKAIQSAVQQ